MKPHIDEEHELVFTVRVRSYGRKSKCVNDTGQTLARILYQAFGDRFEMVDHKGRPITVDPDAHDWGFGET